MEKRCGAIASEQASSSSGWKVEGKRRRFSVVCAAGCTYTFDTSFWGGSTGVPWTCACTPHVHDRDPAMATRKCVHAHAAVFAKHKTDKTATSPRSKYIKKIELPFSTQLPKFRNSFSSDLRRFLLRRERIHPTNYRAKWLTTNSSYLRIGLISAII